MPRQRMQQGYDDYGRRPQGGPQGDYYPQSEGGMPDTRPQRSRDDRRYPPRDMRDRDRYDDPRGGYDRNQYDSYGSYDEYDSNGGGKKKGGAGKVILLILGFLLVALAAFAGGGFLTLNLIGNGTVNQQVLDQFGIVLEQHQDSELLASYGSDIEDAVRDGTVSRLLDAAKTTSDATAVPGATSTTSTPGTTTTPGATTPVTDPSQQQVVDPNANIGTQQQVADPSQQQVVADQTWLDANGNSVVVLISQGQSVMVDANGQQVVVDANGVPVLDANGQQVIVVQQIA